MCFATGPSVRPSAYEYGVVSIVGFLTVGFNSGPRSAKYPQQNAALGFHPGLWPVKYPQWDSLLLGFTPVLRRPTVNSKIPYCCVSLRPSAGEETTAIFRTVGFNSGPRPANYPQQDSALLGFTPAFGRRSIHSWIPHCWVSFRPFGGEVSAVGFLTDGPRLNTPYTAPFLGKGSHQPACQRDLLKSDLRRYSWAACPIEQLGAMQISTNHLRPLFPGTGSHRPAFRNATWTSSSMAAKGRNETQQASMNVTSF